jgi:ribosomal protein S18 acetylase RimI-like enzyme
MSPRLRPAQAEDAAAIGRTHVQAWQESYPGMVPAERIAALDPVERAGVWERAIVAGRHVTLVEDALGIAGLALCGATQSPELDCDGEIQALYLLRRVQRQGLGRALMADMARAMLAKGMRSASLWVLDANLPARRFYSALGGRILQHRTELEQGAPLEETAYGWDRLEVLL